LLIAFAVIYSVFDDFDIFEPQTPTNQNQSTLKAVPLAMTSTRMAFAGCCSRLSLALKWQPSQ
jgi:hypothetical protein